MNMKKKYIYIYWRQQKSETLFSFFAVVTRALQKYKFIHMYNIYVTKPFHHINQNWSNSRREMKKFLSCFLFLSRFKIINNLTAWSCSKQMPLLELSRVLFSSLVLFFLLIHLRQMYKKKVKIVWLHSFLCVIHISWNKFHYMVT